MCGIVVSSDLDETFNLTMAHAHRGRDTFGIAAIGNDGIDVVKWAGPNTFDIADLSRLLSYNKPHTFIGHTRYRTTGEKERDKILESAHPHVLDGRVEFNDNHVIVRNASSAIVHNGQIDQKYLKGVDKALLEKCDTLGALDLINRKGEYKFMEDVPCAFTLAYATPNGVVVMKDRHEMKPGFYGFDTNGKTVVASENFPLQHLGVKQIMPIMRGSIYEIDRNGRIVEKQTEFSEYDKRFHCSFEHKYVMDANSSWLNVPATFLRAQMGRQLAVEHPFKDKQNVIVTYAPRCPVTAAREYAKILGYTFKDVFYKTSGTRSFIGPDETERNNSIKASLFGDSSVDVRGSTVIVIDDSGIRGIVRNRINQLLMESGAKEVIYLSYTPVMCPIVDNEQRGCYWGIDLPANNPEKNYISRVFEGGEWRNKTTEEFKSDIIPTYFLSLEGSHKAFESVGLSREKRCSYCYGGRGPIGRI